MKKSEIAMLILIASVSVVVAFLVAKAIMGDPSERSEKVKTVITINSDFYDPKEDDGVFLKNPINPTVEICTGISSDCKTNTPIVDNGDDPITGGGDVEDPTKK